MTDKPKRPVPTPSPKEGGTRKGGGGWQKPVAPPTKDSQPSGPPRKKD
jgi:hypothetical protein